MVIAERRSVRSSSRRITPSAQPAPSAVTSPQQGRILRKRGARSVSRDVESAPPTTRPIRRSARQASIASESDNEGHPTARRNRRKREEAVATDLTIVEEADLQDVHIVTPPRSNREPITNAHRSPGALSQMSGTTAITSFTSVEAEMLDVPAIIRQLPKLYNESTEFLYHLAPAEGSIDEDNQHIQEMRKPDSDFNQTFRELDQFFDLRLVKFRGEDQQYVRLWAIHRALLGPDRDPSTMWSGVDLVLYLANLTVFAKNMIGSDRNEPEMWAALRELDGSLFPSLFLSSLNPGAEPSPTGESSLLESTFELALQLRVQLAMQVLSEASERVNFNPEEILMELFFVNSKSADQRPMIRGWAMAGLGGESETLPEYLHQRVLDEVEKIRGHFLTDSKSLERGHLVDFESLDSEFPWRTLILQLLDWVRLRHTEIQTAVQILNGIEGISARLQEEMQQPNQVPVKPRKSRASFKEYRRRSSRKFDPHANRVDAAVYLLKEKLAEEAMPSQPVSSRPVQPVHTSVPAQRGAASTEETESALRRDSTRKAANESVQQVNHTLPEEIIEDGTYRAPEDDESEDVVENNVRDGLVEDQMHQPPEDVSEPAVNPETSINHNARSASATASNSKPLSSYPPSSTADFLREFNEGKRLNKENRHQRVVDPQESAQRDGYEDGSGDHDQESAPSRPEPSQEMQGTEPAEAPTRKRRFPFTDDLQESEASSGEEDAFEPAQQNTIARERRQRAPVAKKARIGPSSSAPTSHQPRAQTVATVCARAEAEESLSEVEAPEMTEGEPPRSTLTDIRHLARLNSSAHATQKQRRQLGRGRVAWTDEQEEELIRLMGLYPQQYSLILKEDSEGPQARRLLQDRTQVNLKDKARNLAITFIKSGTGVKKGFENVVPKHTAIGKQLLNDGYDW